MTAVEVTTGILDTSTVILLERLSEADLPDEAFITAVTLAELSVGPLVTDNDDERAARQARLQQAEADFDTGSLGAGIPVRPSGPCYSRP